MCNGFVHSCVMDLPIVFLLCVMDLPIAFVSIVR